MTLPTMPITLRLATAADLPAILEIYNDAVLNLTATYDETPQTLAERQAWFEEHARDRLPVWVAETPAGEVVGWSSLSRFRQRSAYRFTVEDSIYIAPAWRGQGIGKLLLPPLLEAARQLGYHAVMAGIDAEGAASLRLHAHFGFERVAYLREVGFKFGRWLDVTYMEWLVH